MNENLPVQRANGFVPEFPVQANRASSAGERGPREIFSTIFKHKLMILVSFALITVLCCVCVIFYLKFIYKQVYTAKALILIRPGWESQEIDLTLNQRQANFSSSDLLATEMRILMSRELAEKIINEMKPEVIFPNLIQRVRAGLPVAGSAL